jgi:hypothetical protein
MSTRSINRLTAAFTRLTKRLEAGGPALVSRPVGRGHIARNFHVLLIVPANYLTRTLRSTSGVAERRVMWEQCFGERPETLHYALGSRRLIAWSRSLSEIRRKLGFLKDDDFDDLDCVDEFDDGECERCSCRQEGGHGGGR